MRLLNGDVQVLKLSVHSDGEGIFCQAGSYLLGYSLTGDARRKPSFGTVRQPQPYFTHKYVFSPI